MKLNTNIVGLVVSAGVLAAAVICRPSWVGDGNTFLQGFVNHNYLNVLGVILAITLASLAQAHLSFNRLEERRGKIFLDDTRREIKDAAYWLIALFCAGFLIVVVKPLLGTSDTATAISNSLAIFVLIFYVLILIDITIAVFDIKADLSGTDDKQ